METPVFKFQMSYAYDYAKKNYLHYTNNCAHMVFINKSRIQEMEDRVYQ